MYKITFECIKDNFISQVGNTTSINVTYVTIKNNYLSGDLNKTGYWCNNWKIISIEEVESPTIQVEPTPKKSIHILNRKESIAS